MNQVVAASRFSVLVVCTGNVCRSPVAELLLRRQLGEQVNVTSAGTRAMVGSSISGPMIPLLASDGIEARYFTARQLNGQLLECADLILASTRSHRADVVDLYPGAVRRTFTLLEFARLLPLVDPDSLNQATVAERLRVAIPLVAAQRRQTASDDDVADPYGRSHRDYARVFDQIRSSVEVIGQVLGVVRSTA